MIGIMADSHDNLDAVRRAVSLFKDADCRLLLHAGDFVAPFAARELEKAGCPIKAVFGNCDGEKTGLAAVIESFGEIREAPFEFNYSGINILMIHLDTPVEKHAAEGGHSLIVFGHTHKAEARKRGKTLIINPGEAGGWLTGRRTIALFDPSTGKADIVPL
jgi:putative phosphoesterase